MTLKNMKSCLKTVKGLFLNYISYNYLHYNISNKNENNLTRDRSSFHLINFFKVFTLIM